MAEDYTDGDYLGAYSRFFAEFIARVNPHDQLPVLVSAYNVTEGEIVGEIISVTLQYLNQEYCPPSLQAYLVQQVIQQIEIMCKRRPEDCGYNPREGTYASLKLMKAITGKVNEVCMRYLDNSRLALLPPPPSTPLPQVIAGGNKNCRRKMEDRYVILHDLHTIFNIQHDSVANYYAVFDGHAGQDAAVYCATHLHQYLVESVHYPKDPERALTDAFVTTDEEFIEKSKKQRVCGGTTAVCTLLLNKKLYVAWAGDSSAILVKRGYITHLVDPHRLTRNDEVQRIQRMGGVVFQSMGIPRVNGVLSVSRAIGDVPYKPFVTGEPEVKCVALDGTEDFLVLSSDGLTDFLGPGEISSIIYREIFRRPNALKCAHETLLQLAKHAGSEDNITVIVVLLTPASEIVARQNAHQFYCSKLDDILDKMNSKDKPLLLDMDDATRHDALNPSILKHTMFSQDSRNREDGEDDDILASSNGKHENGDADYDYSDLGPETDVDAIDDVAPTVPVKNLSYELYPENEDDDSCREEGKKNLENDPRAEGLDGNRIEVETELIRDHEMIHADREVHIDNNIHEEDEEEEEEDEEEEEEVDNEDDEVIRKDVVRVNDAKVDDVRDVVDDAGPVDYDESPPSPQAIKPLQDALIPEADNVADSEDSEDEWNYYRVDPNKEKDSGTAVNETQENKNEEEAHSSELLDERDKLEIQSQEVEQDIKCESPKEVEPELIDTEISAQEKLSDQGENESFAEQKEDQRAMDFQLNPNAAEFVPVSPQLGTRLNLMEDYPISGSPLKEVSEMVDIQVPSQSEFEEEVCQRPRELDAADEKECTNGEQTPHADFIDFMMDRHKSNISNIANLDDSEISSTKAEFGDETSFLTASEFHRTGVSNVDESFMSSDRDYDIAKDIMAMSFTPSDFEAAFEKGVDLNAVHDLRSVDLDDKNGTIDEESTDDTQSPESHPELTNLTSPEAEKPAETSAVSDEVSTDPVNIPVNVNVNATLKEEEDESTFIDYADQSGLSELMDIQSVHQSSRMENFEQQDACKPEHSPLTDNYSTEFESEKEAISLDNEQLLSPSSAGADETKPIDEASEESVIPSTDLQKDIYLKEADTTSSLSPVPDAMDCASPLKEAEEMSPMAEDVEICSLPIQSSFQPEQQNMYSFESAMFPETSVPTLESNLDGDVQSVSVENSVETVLQPALSTESIKESEKYALEEKEQTQVEEETLIQPDEIPEEVQTGEEMRVHEEEEIKMQSEIEEKVESAMPVQEEPLVQEEPELQLREELPVSVPKEEPQIEAQEELLMSVQDESQVVTAEKSLTQAQEEPEIQMQEILARNQEEHQIQSQDEPQIQPQEEPQMQPQEEPQMQPQEEPHMQPQEEPQMQPQGEPQMQLQEVPQMQPQEELQTQLQDELQIQSQDELQTQLQDEPQIQLQDEPQIQLQDELQIQAQDELQIQSQEPQVKPQEKPQMEEKVKEDLLDFDVEREVCTKSPFEKLEVAPPVPTQDISENLLQDINEPVCPITKSVEVVKSVEDFAKEEIPALETQKETPHVEVNELEVKKETVTLNLSESMQEFTGLEKQLLPEDVPSVKTTLPEVEQEVPKDTVELKELPVTEVKSTIEISEEKVTPLVPTESKEPETEKPAETAKDKVKVGIAATTVAAAAATAVAAGVTAVQAKAKAKPTVKSTKSTTQAKSMPKSTPTSPSKTLTSTIKSTTTTAAKKPLSATARPKDLDASKKPPISSITNKLSAAKSTTAPKAATAATKTTTRTTLGVSRPKSASASPKPSTSISDKKPTTNGDVKPLTKPAAAKTLNKPATATATKTSLVKSSTSTRTSTSSTAAKPKPTSATAPKTTAKPSSTVTASTTTTAATASRPKTASAVSSTTKSRAPATKSPMIDKQIKESANKQISLGRTSTSATTKTTRTSTSASTTTTTSVKRMSTTKVSTTSSVSSSSPTKRSTATKVTSKTSVGNKITSSTGKVKVIQNGVSEKSEVTSTVVAKTNSKHEDDVPKKDLSPVAAPTDNQLIMSSD